MEGRPLRGPLRNPEHAPVGDSAESDEHDVKELFDEPVPVQVCRMAYEAYGRADSLHRASIEELGEKPPSRDPDGEAEEDNVDFKNLIRECMESVYGNS